MEVVPVSNREWEIEESGDDSSDMLSKAGWVFNMGLQLGKNIMITGLFAASVPFVAPPLLLASALGFACSIPFGVIFSSYICTETIMSKLLPIQESSLLMLDYYEEKEFDSVDFRIEAEEICQSEDNIQLVDQEDWAELVVEEEEEPSVRDDSIWISDGEKEEGYEDDMAEYLEENDEVTVGGFPEEEEKTIDEQVQLVVVAVGGHVSTGEEDMDDGFPEEEEKPIDEVQQLVFVAVGGHVSAEKEEDRNNMDDDFSRKTNNLPERIRDEDNNSENTVDYGVKLDKPVTEMNGKEVDGFPEDEEKPIDEQVQLVVVAVGGHVSTGEGDKKNMDDGFPEVEEKPIDEAQQLVFVAVGGHVSAEIEKDRINMEDDFSRMTNNLPERIRDEDSNTENTVNYGGKLDKPVTEMNGKEVDDFPGEEENTMKDDFSTETTNLLQRIRDEGKNTEMNGTETMVDKKENENNKKPISNGNRTETDGFGSLDVTPKDSVKDVVKSNTEGLQIPKDITKEEEEKIWKEIKTLRAIIGHKGETFGSYVDELKALFVVTGVVPPGSFKEQASIGLDDVNHSLQFLKSVVGVK